MRVTPDRDPREEMSYIIQRDNLKIAQFLDKVYRPMMSIFFNVPPRTWLTRQAVIDILEDQWKVGENWWNTGWSQEHGIADWVKESVIWNMVGNNLFESDNDLESFDQFDRLRESSEPLDILRLERLIEERMYIISNRLIQSTWNDSKRLTEQLSKLSNTKPIVKKNWFWFGNRRTISFPWGIKLELFDRSISISEQIWAYSLNTDNPRIQQTPEIVKDESNQISWVSKPALS